MSEQLGATVRPLQAYTRLNAMPVRAVEERAMNLIGRKVLILGCIGLALTLSGTAAVVADHDGEAHEQHFKMRVATVDQDGNVHEETIEVLSRAVKLVARRDELVQLSLTVDIGYGD